MGRKATEGDSMLMIGHSIGDASGRLLTMDDTVADFLQRPKAELRKLCYADITHPDDLPANVSRIARLCVGDSPLIVRKRYILPQGGYLHATVHVSRLQTGSDQGRLVGTIFGPARKDRQTTPADLWGAATRQAQLLVERNASLGSDLFSDGAWPVLLGLYLAEAEGRDIVDGGPSLPIRLSAVPAQKWLNALRARGLVEYCNDRPDRPQLTRRGLDQIETLLGNTLPSTA